MCIYIRDENRVVNSCQSFIFILSFYFLFFFFNVNISIVEFSRNKITVIMISMAIKIYFYALELEKSQRTIITSHIHKLNTFVFRIASAYTRSNRIYESQWPNAIFPYNWNCYFYDAICLVKYICIKWASTVNTIYSAYKKLFWLANKKSYLQIRANEHWFGVTKTKSNETIEQRERERYVKRAHHNCYIATISAKLFTQ